MNMEEASNLFDKEVKTFLTETELKETGMLEKIIDKKGTVTYQNFMINTMFVGFIMGYNALVDDILNK